MLCIDIQGQEGFKSFTISATILYSFLPPFTFTASAISDARLLKFLGQAKIKNVHLY